MELLKNRMVEAHRKGPVHHERCDDDVDDDDLVHSFSSSSSGISSGSSMESDSSEEETSSNFLPSSSSAHDSLSDMSSLLQQLPIKMGLSRHYEGKSRSFISLANVRGLEDLVKEENAEKKKMMMMKMKKKLKCCRRSYGGGGGLWRTNELSRNISKREWNSSRRKPPIPHPHPQLPTHGSTTTISNQTPLFA